MSFALFASSFLMVASPTLSQEAPTATPDAEGVIYAPVQAGDTLWSIAARHQLSLPELLDLNGLTESDFIQPGELLIVGYGDPPATATPLPTITPTFPPPPPPATAVSPAPTGICFLAFDDRNQDGIFDGSEALKAGVAITLFNNETVVANYVTNGVSEPFCLDNLSPGEYRVTRSLNQVQGEVATTEGNQGIILGSGQQVNLAFGSIDRHTAADPLSTPPVAQTAVPADKAVSTQERPAWPWLVASLLLIAAGIYWVRRR